MTEQDLIKFKELSMQDGRLNLSWFADYVAQAERQECANLADRKSTRLNSSHSQQSRMPSSA